MKVYNPPQRLIALGLVLQYDTESDENKKTIYFTTGQRIVINQERSAIMQGLEYKQNEWTESKIQFVIGQIITTKWNPEKPIPYVLNQQ